MLHYEEWDERRGESYAICADCIRYTVMTNMEPYLRLILNIYTVSVSGILYYECGKVLLVSKTITRKGLLTKAFAAILVLWVLLVLPHVCFMDFKRKGSFSSMGKTFLTAAKARLLGLEETKPIVEKYPFLQYLHDDGSTQHRLSIIDVSLRGLRFSYGFVNTLIIMVLTKPFHAPLIAVKDKMKKFFKPLAHE
ncbi:uncharacterized protein LOC142340698 [Convolutriloba macropyga]|uniref:uncharacterized protein LOC142340698 n=1 Tax=Convolutriloba macropyga TaxID=536237 RepID=UPI003F520009